MKHVWLVIRGNIRRNKGSFIGILLLMFVVSVSFVTIFNVTRCSKTRQDEALKETGFGDYWSALRMEELLNVDGTSTTEIIEKLEESDLIGKVSHIPSYNLNLQVGDYITDWTYLIDIDNGSFTYRFFDANDNEIKNLTLNDFDIVVPKCFATKYKVNIGDELRLKRKDKEDIKFKVVAYLEDPFMGASLMGIKTNIVNKNTCDFLEKLYEEEIAEKKGNVYVQKMEFLTLFKADTDMKDAKFERELNRTTNYFSFTDISLSTKQSKKYTMTVVNLFSAIAFAFIIILLFAAFIVMGHSINSSIEQDYVNLGIYKALGMTSKGIRLSLAISYSIASIIGLLLGIPVAIPLIKMMNGIMSNSTSLFFKANIHPAMTLAMIFVTVLIVVFFVMLKSHKVVVIAPVVALNEGRKSVNFSSAFNLKISKKFLNSSIAYRQFSSNIKKYVSIMIITALLGIFMVIMNNVYAWSKDSDAISDMFTYTETDGYISYRMDHADEVEQLIRQYSDFSMHSMYTSYIMLDDVQMVCAFISDPNRFSSITDGRTCLYDNEILITPYIADEFDLKLGSTVKVTISGVSRDMVVSGIFDFGYDMGKAFAMSEDAKAAFGVGEYADGYDELFSNSTVRYKNGNIVFEDKSQIRNIVDAIHEKYGTEYDTTTVIRSFNCDNDFAYESALGDIGVGIQAMTLLVYVFGAVFICITISLVASKIMHSEKKDYGIYKSIGLPSGKLRSQMAIKFMVVCVIGSLFGSIISIAVTKPLLRKIFYQFGVSHYTAALCLADLIIPIIFMGLMGYVCAYISSRKIKKVEPRILITE